MEAGTIPQRPPKVKLAVNLLYVELGIRTLSVCTESAGIPTLDELLEFLGALPMILLAVAIIGVWPLLYYSIGKGKSWAWMTLLILPLALALLLLPTSFIVVIIVFAAVYGIWFGAWFGLYYMIGKGRSWARTILLVLSIFAIPTLFILVFTEISVPLVDPLQFSIRSRLSSPLRLAVTILQIASALLQVAALILLFQRDSSNWFKAMKVGKIQEEKFGGRTTERDPAEALIGAARKGDMKQIQDLLAKGADVNAQNKWGLTPLMAAAHGGHTIAGKLLLEKGADVNAMQHGGWTALMCAAVKGHINVVDLLLGKGAHPNARTDSRMTALTLARANGRSEVGEILKANGAEA